MECASHTSSVSVGVMGRNLGQSAVRDAGSILYNRGASDIVNVSSDYETGEVRFYIILLQNNRLRPERNEKLASRLCLNWKSRNHVTEWIALRQSTVIF